MTDGEPMKILVCVKQTASGEINPFDACAYEAALRTDGAEVTLISMGPMKSAGFLTSLTRLGAKRAVLLSDTAFAGADTLATAYALSLAVKRLSPDLILCGRQTVDGDTGQVGPMLAAMTDYRLITNVMSLTASADTVTCTDRSGNTAMAAYPALLTVERINTLRLPSIRSRSVETEIWSASDIGADVEKCGQSGSPTRVLQTIENSQDRRKCTFIAPNEFDKAVNDALISAAEQIKPQVHGANRLSRVYTVGTSPIEMAKTVSDDITVIDMDTPQALAAKIAAGKPNAVLWGSDPVSKAVAPQVAVLLKTGLCADCTMLEADGDKLIMYRPAFSGNVIAKIECTAFPAMATVRTAESEPTKVIFGVGRGAAGCIDRISSFAERFCAEIAASRLMVDDGYYPYEKQVGLTGKTVSPDVYIALGISGAVHHIAGIRSAKKIIAVNKDKNADIFKYSDYGIVCDIAELL